MSFSSLLTNVIDSVSQKLSRKLPTVGAAQQASGAFLYQKCAWCGEQVDAEECFAMYTGVSLVCEICGKDVTSCQTS
jgi:hypothetical protein